MVYRFKTDEDIDTLSRTIVKTEDVPATIKEVEFRLEDKLKQLESLKKQKIDIEKQISDLTIEINEVKTELNIK